MDWAFLYTSFEGRISRKTFWIAFVVLTVAELVGYIVAEQLQGDRLSAIIDVAFVYPEFAITLKRAHDRNMPVPLLVAFFVASAFLDFLTVLQVNGTPEEPNVIFLAIWLPFALLGLFLLIELGFRKGVDGPNQYGPDPLAKA